MPKSVLKFENNRPTEIALAFAQGKITPSRYGADEVMYTLEYPPEHITFLDLSVSQKINQLRAAQGERLMICKRKGAERGAAVRWDVWLSASAEKARAAEEAGVEVQPNGRPAWGGNPPAQRAPAVADPDSVLERQLRASLAEVEERKRAAAAEAARVEKEKAEAAVRAAAPVPAAIIAQPPATQHSANGIAAGWAQTLLAHANALSDVFAAAMLHANKHGDAVEPDDVRTFVVTAFINLSKKGAQ